MRGDARNWAARRHPADTRTVSSAADQTSERAPISYLDPGWLYLLAGIALLAATVLIPAMDELAEARAQRDRALALEQHRVLRLGRYRDYLEALDRQEPSLVMALAASQLKQIPQGRSLILEPPDVFAGGGSASASVFAGLEPPALTLPERQKVDSILARWTTDDRSRTWLIAGGAVCLLMGLLPRSQMANRK
jgi:hypothetical protein